MKYHSQKISQLVQELEHFQREALRILQQQMQLSDFRHPDYRILEEELREVEHTIDCRQRQLQQLHALNRIAA